MLNNILAQFLRQLQRLGIHSALVHLPKPKDRLELSELCDIFLELARSLPSGSTLLCVLDGTGFYEDNARRAELVEVLRMLRSLEHQNYEVEKTPLFKILTTAPIGSSVASRIFNHHEVFHMAETYPHDGGFP